MGLRPVVAFASVLLALSGCGSGGGSAEAAGSCPGTVRKLIDADHKPDEEIAAVVDATGSSDNRSATFDAQIRAVVDTAVERSAALRVMAFAGSASSVVTVATCDTTRPRVRNDAARERLTNRLATALYDEVSNRLRAEIRRLEREPTDVAGAFRAVADSAPLASRRVVVVLTDAVHTAGPVPEPVNLAGIDVLIHGVGRHRGSADASTKNAALLADRWTDWLRRGGARTVRVSTQPYSGGMP